MLTPRRRKRRPAVQVGVVKLLHRGKEGIEIGVDDATGHATRTMMLHTSPACKKDLAVGLSAAEAT
ncbi:MAG: hypothetical protein AMJ38_00785 [Dehalococcoidia bacterium DG_22]|nr:MAG: hypothetical protein AMJ38_00785 [Dehalococcoidia bacterium DG_22]